ncbi:ATP-binding cassette sub-family F member 3 [Nymphon striatum]|nr:ATP-binding cassette sub-family F member 3 [Nymphon striatum]
MTILKGNTKEDLLTSINCVLENAEDFNSVDDVYEAIGEMLCGASQKDEIEIRKLCSKLHNLYFRVNSNSSKEENQRVLDAPVNIGELSVANTRKTETGGSIWIAQRDGSLQVDQRKLEKAEIKLKQKQDKRDNVHQTPFSSNAKPAGEATANQTMSKKDSKMEAKGTNKSKDVRIENFDVMFGNKVLLIGAELLLSFGRRYGFVGRNGIGKTTVLRMIAQGQLKIPKHISILHVEQEVVGDDTIARDSVLQSDELRESLMAEEREITKKLQDSSNSQEPTKRVSESDDLSSRLTEVYAQLELIEADKAPARASLILAGLGFTAHMQNQATKKFSGGWRMRIALARALFSQPDLLLLDEPTNMLDMKAIIWLENYLETWATTLLVVSHDRQFLESVPTDILHLHSQRIDAYKGNYDKFVQTREEKLKNQQREFEAQQQYRAHAQAFIDRFRFNANRAALVQSRVKQLEKLPVLKPVEKESGVTFKFSDPEELAPPIFQLDEVGFHYVDCLDVLKKVDLSASMSSRICVVGDNGSGKTTLLKLILGELWPTSGMRTAHRNLKFGYFSQHHIDQLDMNVNSVELLASRFRDLPVEEYRRQLGCFGVSGDLALQSIASLSGGQKSRVAFASMCMANPNFFILDEPTNHLDVETIEALGEALVKFKVRYFLI